MLLESFASVLATRIARSSPWLRVAKKPKKEKSHERNPACCKPKRSSLFLQIFHADGRAESFATAEAMNVAPVLSRRFQINDGAPDAGLRLPSNTQVRF